MDKAQQSATLQAARNAYTATYTLDLSDGVLDKKDGTTDITDANYTVTGEGTEAKATYSYTDTKSGYTATFDGSKWTVSK